MISYLRSAHPALKLGVACASFGALAAFGQLGANAAAKPSPTRGDAGVAAAPPAFRFASVDAATAERMNAAQPLSPAMLNAARPFVLAGATADRARALKCLTEAVYYEAASEPLQGRRAVAQVVLNRVRHPLFPHSVCGVVYQGASLGTGCQFSFVCDGSMERGRDEAAWSAAQVVARDALNGVVEPAVGEATHYHATYVAPYWAPSVAKVAHIGLHIFYRWTGLQGMPSAFTARYAAVERIPVVKPHVIAAEPLQLASAPEAEIAGGRLESAVLALGAGTSAPAADVRVHLVLDAQGYAAPVVRVATPAVIAAPLPMRIPAPSASRTAGLSVLEVGKVATRPALGAVAPGAKPASQTSAASASSNATAALTDGPLVARPAV